MGTQVAPTYAIIFINAFEEKFIYKHPKWSRIWYRFIDDVFGVFRGTEHELFQFFEYCNSVHNSIKFYFEYSNNEVTFLDLVIYRNKQI